MEIENFILLWIVTANTTMKSQDIKRKETKLITCFKHEISAKEFIQIVFRRKTQNNFK